VQIWDDNVSLGRLIGSNREYIEQTIPHIGSLLNNSLEQVIKNAAVVVIGTRGVDRQKLQQLLRPEQKVIDLVNLEKKRRVQANATYAGICW
jgi:GDP-mannose 6-dehydrogenase